MLLVVTLVVEEPFARLIAAPLVPNVPIILVVVPCAGISRNLVLRCRPPKWMFGVYSMPILATPLIANLVTEGVLRSWTSPENMFRLFTRTRRLPNNRLCR